MMIHDAGYEINRIASDLWYGKMPKIHTTLVPTVPMTDNTIGTADYPMPRSAPGNRSIQPHRK